MPRERYPEQGQIPVPTEAKHYSLPVGLKFIYRADGKPFGEGAGANRRNVTLAEGWVKSLAAYRDQAAGKSYVYAVQGGKIIANKGGWPDYYESDTKFVDKLVVLAGENEKKLAELPVRRPRSVVARYGTLHVLHQNEAGSFMVSTAG